jgi:hypothetical protein
MVVTIVSLPVSCSGPTVKARSTTTFLHPSVREAATARQHLGALAMPITEIQSVVESGLGRLDLGTRSLFV